MTKLGPNSVEAQADGMKPPVEPVKVRCLHCDGLFMSSEMKWERRDGLLLWWCPDDVCDGAGFDFDLIPVKGEANG